MKRTMVTIIVLLVVALVADFLLRGAAENAAGTMIDRKIPQEVDPEVRLGDFPFLWSVLRGRFDRIEVQIPSARAGALVVDDIGLTFEDVQLEALEVLGGRGNLRARSLRGSGVISQETLNRVLQDEVQGLQLSVENGRVIVSRGDVSVPATMVIAGDDILLRAGDLVGPIEIPLPELLPEISFSSLQTSPGEVVIGVNARRVRIRS